MSITISADDPRSIRAIEIAADADQWRIYRDADGHAVYGVPSQSEPGRFYRVTSASCDCPDFERHALPPTTGENPGEERACKHILAVRLHRELARAQQLRPRPTTQRRRDHLHLQP